MDREERIDRLVEEAQDRGSAANERTPEDGLWGVYSYGDAPPAIGGGLGCFMWFESRELLCDYLGRLLPFLSPGPGEADHLAVAAANEAVFHRFLADGLSVEETIDQANTILRRFSQIEWIGRLSGLMAGDAPFERALRARFRSSDSDDDEGSGRPLDPQERDVFVEFVRTFVS